MATSTQSISDSVLASINGTGTSKSGASANTSDRFLKLLTTQLRNQDPLNPMDNAQMTSQLAQISTVDGLTKLNATLEKLVSGSQDAETLQAAALVGRSVLVDGKHLQLASGQAIGGVSLSGDADAVKVEIKDANGLLVRTLNLGALDAGNVNFLWDGKNESGAQAVDGAYSMQVTATRGGEAVSATALELARVNSVSRGAAGTSINLGSQGTVSLDDIKQIL